VINLFVKPAFYVSSGHDQLLTFKGLGLVHPKSAFIHYKIHRTPGG